MKYINSEQGHYYYHYSLAQNRDLTKTAHAMCAGLVFCQFSSAC